MWLTCSASCLPARCVVHLSISPRRWSSDRVMGNQWTGGPWESSCMSFWWAALLSSETPPRNCLGKSSAVSGTLSGTVIILRNVEMLHTFQGIFFFRGDVHLSENSSNAVVNNVKFTFCHVMSECLCMWKAWRNTWFYLDHYKKNLCTEVYFTCCICKNEGKIKH